ncbi:LysR family transcriptional regulator [Breoghania corrubedonensis]|uniref:LysR family transcriptional regulator n=1 Tax=Breoghania corrubedonensis TaxID=665038 RepID=A0A2T5VI52_9HYPH|nr:LysR family transcriptional regulator [Breoghania corrubedonensis]PTW63396.1 LysR family transcriptional regulator [Breoghania corrubedonensis]
MTFEQLSIFVAVAEREHLTRAAEALHLTPSAVSSALRALEGHYGVTLFDRVGRGLVLNENGRLFLGEAKAVLARAEGAQLVLAELGGLRRGRLTVAASQTIAGYWLPPFMMRFHARFPGIELSLSIGNTATVAGAVLAGEADMGFVEGHVDVPALSVEKIAEDALIVVVGADHPWADGQAVAPEDLATGSAWVLRERGSGTRSEFEAALAAHGVEAASLQVVLELPSNEAVLSAARSGMCAAVVSASVAGPLLSQGDLVAANYELPARAYSLLHHRERRLSRSATELISLCKGGMPASAGG